MQRLQNIFRRKQPATLAQESVKAPVPLSADDLKKVAGGLPNVGGFSAVAPTPTAPSTLGG